MYALAIHGGAGALPRVQFTAAREDAYRHGLMQALAAGQRLLERGGCALDAVEAAVTVLEDNPLFNAGRGAVLGADGAAELDAAIMDGTDLRAGAVAQIRHIQNPVQLARRVLEDSSHVFLVGAGAESYAEEVGFRLVDNDYFITPDRQHELEALKRRPARAGGAWATQAVALDEPPLGTVGAVACDAGGRLAAATSTGGIAGKRAGRVGDSPVIGAGTYADNQTCAVSTTGHGEWFLRTVQAYDIAARLRYGGYSLASAVSEAITRRLSGLGAAGGLIAVDQRGEIVMRYNTPAMFRASVRDGEAARLHIY
ncbi:MAG: isoaspartyl peptidase/L-asparaginase family protein [Steroidobacteraceae bacterium]|jgi:L-asparaginase / beta-aspartyl-peptidase